MHDTLLAHLQITDRPAQVSPAMQRILIDTHPDIPCSEKIAKAFVRELRQMDVKNQCALGRFLTTSTHTPLLAAGHAAQAFPWDHTMSLFALQRNINKTPEYLHCHPACLRQPLDKQCIKIWDFAQEYDCCAQWFGQDIQSHLHFRSNTGMLPLKGWIWLAAHPEALFDNPFLPDDIAINTTNTLAYVPDFSTLDEARSLGHALIALYQFLRPRLFTHTTQDGISAHAIACLEDCFLGLLAGYSFADIQPYVAIHCAGRLGDQKAQIYPFLQIGTGHAFLEVLAKIEALNADQKAEAAAHLARASYLSSTQFNQLRSRINANPILADVFLHTAA